MTNASISVSEISARLSIGRAAVYKLLEQRIIPSLRIGRRWLITRHAYEQWERSCGTDSNSSDPSGIRYSPT
jgi:excisionase family DNA binding protein